MDVVIAYTEELNGSGRPDHRLHTKPPSLDSF